MDDSVQPWTTIVSNRWELHPEPNSEDREIIFRFEFPHFIDSSRNDLSAQKILRTLGFRPPHSSFFLLSYPDLIRLRAFTHARVCREFDITGKYIDAAHQRSEGMQRIYDANLLKDAVAEITNKVQALLYSLEFLILFLMILVVDLLRLHQNAERKSLIWTTFTRSFWSLRK